LLRRRSDEDLVERHPSRPRDRERDDLGDVFGLDGQVLDERLGRTLGVGVRDVIGQLCRDGAGLDDGNPDVGLQFLASTSPVAARTSAAHEAGLS
jgi:hypothetical protein